MAPGSGIRCGCLYCSTVPPLRANRRFWNSAQEPSADRDGTNWAESAGVSLVGVFHVVGPQLEIGSRGQKCLGVWTGKVACFDQERVMGRLVPRGEQQVRPQTKVRLPLRGLHRGDHLVFRELFAGEAGKMSPLVEELDHRGTAVESHAPDQVVDVVSVKAARGGQDDEVVLPLDQIDGLDRLGRLAVGLVLRG